MSRNMALRYTVRNRGRAHLPELPPSVFSLYFGQITRIGFQRNATTDAHACADQVEAQWFVPIDVPLPLPRVVGQAQADRQILKSLPVEMLSGLADTGRRAAEGAAGRRRASESGQLARPTVDCRRVQVVFGQAHLSGDGRHDS